MAVMDLTLLTAADFDNFIADHMGDEIYEFVDGKMVQVPCKYCQSRGLSICRSTVTRPGG